MMPHMRCEILEGPRDGFKTIGVPSVEGHTEYLAIEERFLVRQNGDFLLPVDVMGKDLRQHIALVRLPFEADSSANRVWVHEELLSEPNEVPA